MMKTFNTKQVPLGELKLPVSVIKYSQREIDATKSALKRFGLPLPIVIDGDKNVILGEHFYSAAKLLDWESIKAVCIEDLKPNELKAFRIAFTKIQKFGEFDFEILKNEVLDVMNDKELNLSFEELGFDSISFDNLLFVPEHKEEKNTNPDIVDSVLELGNIKNIVQPGDLILLGDQKVLCADSLNFDSYKFLLGEEQASILITDPPYNVKIGGNVTKQKHHKEFAQASGEMTDNEFRSFLSNIFANLNSFTTQNSLHYIFMDWKHSYLLQNAVDGIYSKLLNICIWDKTKAGMGAFYRSQHEFCFVYQNGSGQHINNIQLGKNGRNRSNIWQYEGMNISTKQANKLRQLHPTVKPVPMLVDIMLDASLPGDIVLDCFGGSGSTLIAAEQCGRKARLIEIDPHYCDVIIHRWEELTGKKHKILNREVDQ